MTHFEDESRVQRISLKHIIDEYVMRNMLVKGLRHTFLFKGAFALFFGGYVKILKVPMMCIQYSMYLYLMYTYIQI